MDLHTSQIPSLSVENESLTILLEKFSFAVTPAGTTSHQWVHDTRKDKLILTFRQTHQPQGNTITEGPLVMSVTVGTEILERQDLRKLAAVAENFEGQRRRDPVDRALEPPVHVVVKLPCIALRYPTSHTLRRRIQMRFKNEADYQRVINIFMRLNFPMNNAVERDIPTAPIGQLRPASSSPLRKHSNFYQKDLLSLSGTVNRYNGISGSVGSTPYAPHNPNLTESPFFQRPQTASSETMRPSSSLSLNNSSSWDKISSVSVGEPLARSTSVVSGVGNHSSILGSDIERGIVLPKLSNAASVGDQIAYPALSQVSDRYAPFSRGSMAPEAFGPALQKAQASSANRTWSESAFELGLNERAVSIYGDLSGNIPDMNKQSDTRISLVPDFLRPVSAPTQSNLDSITQWLPPRRELPFPKNRLSTKSLTASVDIKSLAAPNSGFHESPVGEPSQFALPQSITPSLNPHVRRIAQRRANLASPAVKDNILCTDGERSTKSYENDIGSRIFGEREEAVSPPAGKGATMLRPSTAPGLRSKGMNSATRKRPMEVEPETTPVRKQARSMEDKATQTQTLSGRDHTIPDSLKTGGGWPTGLVSDEAIQAPDAFMNEIEAFISKHKHRAAPQELWQRPDYAEASAEERQTIISDFICENLDNEDFIKLCEDTENVWQRIGLEKSTNRHAGNC